MFPATDLLFFRLLDDLVISLDNVLIGAAGLVGRSRVRRSGIEFLARGASLFAHAGFRVDLLRGSLDRLLDILGGGLDLSLVVLLQGLPSALQLGLDLLLGRVIDGFLPFLDVLLGLVDQGVETVPGFGLLTPILVFVGVGSLPVARSLALTCRIPFASMSNVTSTCGTPRGAGGIPVSWNRPIVLLSPAIGRSPWRT